MILISLCAVWQMGSSRVLQLAIRKIRGKVHLSLSLSMIMRRQKRIKHKNAFPHILNYCSIVHTSFERFQRFVKLMTRISSGYTNVDEVTATVESKVRLRFKYPNFCSYWRAVTEVPYIDRWRLYPTVGAIFAFSKHHYPIYPPKLS